MKVLIVTLCLFAAAYGAVIQKSDLLKALTICPVVDCAFMRCLDDENQQDQLFNWNGMKCPGCQTCTRLRPIDVKRDTINNIIKLNMCPMTMCAQPTGCARTELVMGYFEFQGKKCPGCMHCPVLSQ